MRLGEREMGDWKDCNRDCVNRELVGLGERWGTGKTATETV